MYMQSAFRQVRLTCHRPGIRIWEWIALLIFGHTGSIKILRNHDMPHYIYFMVVNKALSYSPRSS